MKRINKPKARFEAADRAERILHMMKELAVEWDEENEPIVTQNQNHYKGGGHFHNADSMDETTNESNKQDISLKP